MQICRMNYNELSPDGKRVKLHVYGVGSFDVLFSIDRYINKPHFSDREKAAVTQGTYRIVDRHAGAS